MEEKRPGNNARFMTPEIEAKLKRLEELEAEQAAKPDYEATQAKLIADNEALKARLIERGLQPDQHGIRTISREVKDEDGTVTVKEFYAVMIDLPPSGGISLTRNGIPFYHGQEYEFNYQELCDVREQMYRSWQHERTIKGSDENAYRPQLQPVVNGRGRFAR